MPPPQASLSHYLAQQRLARRVALQARALWRQMNPADFDGSWRLVGPRLVALLTAGQLTAARNGAANISDVLVELGIDVAPLGVVVPEMLAGVSSSGYPLGQVLYEPVIDAKQRVAAAKAQGTAMSGRTSLMEARSLLDGIILTQIADAARAAAGAGITARPRIGYVRMLNPPSCSRCTVLAGRFYRWNAGFHRHPRCFPAGVVVNGPASEAATRRWYEGELVVLTTASGQELPLTGNHPVLTSRGWVPANLLEEGDEVVRSTRPEGAAPLVVPDHHQVPARIEDVWSALSVAGLDSVESSPEDFHGDGQHGKVDVVRADRPLDGRILSALPQHGEQVDLAVTSGASLRLAQQGGSELLDLSVAASAYRAVGGGGLGLALSIAHLSHSHETGLAGPAALDPGAHEAFGDDSTGYAVLTGEGVLARSGEVGDRDLLGGDDPELSRWDAPGDAFTVETAGGYTARGRDLLNRLSGQVELDRVVQLRRVKWSGHVYSLTSAEGWHVANSLIVSNCDCRHIPSTEQIAGDLRTDPDAYFRSLTPAEQDRTFTRAGAQAMRDGADMGQVVNARRGAAGMSPAGARLTRAEQQMLQGGRDRGRLQTTSIYGRDLYLTTEGTTVRGVAGKQLAQRGGTSVGRDSSGRKLSRANAPRLMPESIYQIAGDDRAEAIRLLRLNGYIT